MVAPSADVAQFKRVIKKIKALFHEEKVQTSLSWVPCKRRSSVKSGAWLRRSDDVTGVEKSCGAKGINGKKAKEKYFIIANQ